MLGAILSGNSHILAKAVPLGHHWFSSDPQFGLAGRGSGEEAGKLHAHAGLGARHVRRSILHFGLIVDMDPRADGISQD